MIQKYNTPDIKIANQEFELYKEDGKYYLRIDFDYENEHGLYKGHVDKIKFDMLLAGVEYNQYGSSQNVKAEFIAPTDKGYTTRCSFDVLTGSKNNFFTIELVKEKFQEMTVEEIEKKLGHKVKIVSRKFRE